MEISRAEEVDFGRAQSYGVLRYLLNMVLEI